MAIKYQVSGLRNLAISKFTEAVKTGWDHNSFVRTIFAVYNSPQTTSTISETSSLTPFMSTSTL